MKLKPVSKIVSMNNYMRFEPLYECRCPKCNMMLHRKKDKCENCGQEIDWSDWK